MASPLQAPKTPLELYSSNRTYEAVSSEGVRFQVKFQLKGRQSAIDVAVANFLDMRDALTGFRKWELYIAGNSYRGPQSEAVVCLINPEMRNVLMIGKMVINKNVNTAAYVNMIHEVPNAANSSREELQQHLYFHGLIAKDQPLKKPNEYLAEEVRRFVPTLLHIRSHADATSKNVTVLVQVNYKGKTTKQRMVFVRNAENELIAKRFAIKRKTEINMHEQIIARAELQALRQVFLHQLGAGEDRYVGAEQVVVEVSNLAARQLLNHTHVLPGMFVSESAYLGARLKGSRILPLSTNLLPDREAYETVELINGNRNEEFVQTPVGPVRVTIHAVEKMAARYVPDGAGNSWGRLLKLCEGLELLAGARPFSRLKHNNNTVTAGSGNWAMILGDEPQGQGLRVIVTVYRMDQERQQEIVSTARSVGDRLYA
ncbi:hypothetical protein HNP46_006748 [Pseudomonas nitritireducens]|uniref:Uncharacterized protein n=1 Tax=Pseudomonas nitroreducens TaxID=46680 RepID=A0A7W7P5C8_PSENT|nr:hypothetical protein [Pseudomonas nitritireducens]MBB4867829.1 hypothetical protein [Pseudomonas nitritireducens]